MRSQTQREAEAEGEEKEVQQARDVQLEVVRDVGGRPLFLTPKRFLRICRHIAEGESASEACRLELVSYRSFRLHVARSDKYQERLKRAEAAREDYLREYHIANVRKHAPRNLLASLWWLERTAPSRFALRPVYRPEAQAEAAIGDKIDESQLRRYAELMAEFKRENEFKAVAQTVSFRRQKRPANRLLEPGGESNTLFVLS
jgi:hypothetical protein